MVQRISNPVGFTVLVEEPVVDSGIVVEILDGATGAELAILEDTWDRKWTDEFNGIGAGSFKVLSTHHKLVDDPDLLKYGNLARLWLDGVARFVFQIDARPRTLAGAGDDIATVITVSGRGALCLLEDGVVYPEGGIAGPTERPFNTNAGDMLLTTLQEAQVRGAVAIVGASFNAINDSRGVPWIHPIDLNERAGQTDVLRLALKTTEVAADVRMNPSLVLEVYNDRGVDRSIQTADTGPVELRIGENIRQVEVADDGVVKNVLVITSAGGLVERIDASSITEYRRRESTLSVGDVTDPSQITRHADAVFRRTGSPSDRTVYQLTESAVVLDGRTPYRHFDNGDTIVAPNGNGELTPQVVYAITVSENAVGRPEYTVELASLAADFEERLGRWMAALSRGAVSGIADRVAEPTTPSTTQIEATASEEADAAVAEHVATFLHPDEFSDLADVNVAGVNDFDFVWHNSGVWVPRTLVLNDADDVDTTGAVNGQVLQRVAGVWQGVTLATVFTPVSVRRSLSTSHSHPNNSQEPVPWDQVEWNEASTFLTWNATNDNFDVIRDCGVIICVGVQMFSDPNGERITRVLVNGSPRGTQRDDANATDFTIHCVTTDLIPLSNGDTVGMDLLQDSGGALNVSANQNSFLSVSVLRDDG